MGELEMIEVIKTMNCRMLKQALIFVLLGHGVHSAIEEAIESDLNLTLEKAKIAGLKV